MPVTTLGFIMLLLFAWLWGFECRNYTYRQANYTQKSYTSNITPTRHHSRRINMYMYLGIRGGQQSIKEMVTI